VRRFVYRLVQRSRGEAVAAEPYRAPRLTPRFAPPNAVSALASVGQHPTADRVAFQAPVQDPPQAPDDHSTPRVKPGPLSGRPKTPNPSASPVREVEKPKGIHVTMDNTGVKTPPVSGDPTRPPGRQHAGLPGAPPEGETPRRIDCHETRTHTVGPAASQSAERVQQAWPLTRWHDRRLEQTGQTQTRGDRYPAQPKHRQAGASRVDHAATAVVKEAQTIDVDVHIGRIDIRATTSNPLPAQHRAAKTQTTMSLDDYIQGRTGGRR
jgi:hypothetical protein